MFGDLSVLPHNLNEQRECRVIVETPRGFRHKIGYDPSTGAFRLRHVLADGMSFPVDFGFIPSTRGEDGDPIDVMVFAEEPFFPGCMLDVRLIGVVEAVQTADGETYRNDRLAAVPLLSRRYAHAQSFDHMPEGLVEEINQFWVTYNRLRGRTFEVLNIGDGARAVSLLEAAILPT